MKNKYDIASLGSSIDTAWCQNTNSFETKTIRKEMDELILPSTSCKLKWIKFVPEKVNMFVWRASIDHIPSKMTLAK